MIKDTKTMTKAAILLAFAIVFQMVKLGQWFTGIGINAVLIIAASTCGLFWAAVIGSLTPLLAMYLGVLPPAVLPVVPFIVAGNILYASLYWLIKKHNEYEGLAAAALIKFGLLYCVVNYFLKVPTPIKVAMSIPQLITAVSGGILALIVLKVFKRIK